ncbi:serine proteinase stubble [Lucilia sericata]|uniref:serine proteinase stubble n=1 Tax=Lucilia sericata TaxID=13632 RepID=UPI0018A8252E|nr:serine proteinase stubble [Lucilia sericata]XP_037813510.1 serine proteinase stubble [Lucilia sericata]
MRKNRYSRQWLVNQYDDNDHNHDGANKHNVTGQKQNHPAQNYSTLANTNGPAAFHPFHKNFQTQTHFHSHLHPQDSSRNEPLTVRRRHLDFYLRWPLKKSCFNQILEVLLALVLVNCLLYRLTHLPLALAAYGDLQPARGYHHQAEASAFSSNFRNSESLNLNSNEDEEDSFFRQPHNIGGSAFGYNGLQIQHNLDDNLLRSQNFKISPKPCSTGRIEGTCMFVWECIKSEGRHVGMCVDSFMFGSCCVHNYTDNIVQQNTFSYTRPTKPLGIGSMNHRPRPPQQPHRPSISGMTTIERPHGAGTLVIRPSGPHHQGALLKPHHSKPPYASTALSSSATSTTSTTTTDDPTILWTSNSILGDLQSSASIASATTINHQQQQHWHLTTEPNFITKPRPPSWDKPSTLRPKPPKPPKLPKPSKKPTTALDWLTQQQLQQQLTQKPSFNTHSTSTSTTTTATTIKNKPSKNPVESLSSTTPTTATTTLMMTTTTTKTKPQVVAQSTKPTSKPSPNTTKPYTKPTSSVSSSTAITTTTTTTTSSTSALPSTSMYIPTKPATTSSTTSTSYSQKPSTAAASKPTTTTAVFPTKPSQRPTSSQRPSTTTTAASSSSNTLPPPHNLSSIESNEISDHLDIDSATIKTISAARSECGTPVLTRPETRIVGGKSAAFGRWPWQVSVRRTSFFGFSSTHRCGGALINENWIATAGHCVDDLLISQIRIRVGEYDFSHVQEQLPYIERGVAKKVVHPLYNFFTYEYDLALVKLEQPLEFAPHVSPICLPQTDSLLIGMNATVTGWGRLSEGGTLPSVLQEVSVPIVSNDNCKSMFLRAGRQEFIPEIFLCAGYETGGQDSCQGDSGGPLQVKSQDGRYFLAGIISWGIGCAEANLPGVCTRISKFVPWIIENVT